MVPNGIDVGQFQISDLRRETGSVGVVLLRPSKNK
jgi:hypothetical protein